MPLTHDIRVRIPYRPKEANNPYIYWGVLTIRTLLKLLTLYFNPLYLMRKNVILLVFLLFSIVASIYAQKSCIIKGVVKNRPNSKTLYIAPYNTDWRVSQYPKIAIKDDGTFCYELKFDDEVLYELVFEDELSSGSWRPIQFMIEDGTFEFELYPIDDWMKNAITGLTTNKVYQYLIE